VRATPNEVHNNNTLCAPGAAYTQREEKSINKCATHSIDLFLARELPLLELATRTDFTYSQIETQVRHAVNPLLATRRTALKSHNKLFSSQKLVYFYVIFFIV
jgi:hypothetical protein